jgi:hypothetical protein
MLYRTLWGKRFHLLKYKTGSSFAACWSKTKFPMVEGSFILDTVCSQRDEEKRTLKGNET